MTKTFREWFDMISDKLAKAIAKEGYTPNFVWNNAVEQKGKDWVDSEQISKDEFVDFITHQTGLPYSYRNRINRWFGNLGQSHKISSSTENWNGTPVVFKATTRNGKFTVLVTDDGDKYGGKDRYAIVDDYGVDYSDDINGILANLVFQSAWKEGTYDKVLIDDLGIADEYLSICRQIRDKYNWLEKEPKGSKERQFYFEIGRYFNRALKRGTPADQIFADVDNALAKQGINSSRKPIKSAMYDVIIKDLDTNEILVDDGPWYDYESANDFGKEKEKDFKAEGRRVIREIKGYHFIDIQNSRRPIKSSLQTEVVENFPEYMVYYAYYGEDNSFDVTDEDIKLFEEWRERNGYGHCYGYADDENQYVEKSFDSHPAFGLACDTVPVVFEKIQSSRKPVKSARFLAEDDDGQILAEADTYEEAESVAGCTKVIDTESQNMEGQEDMGGLFQSRKITSAVEGGWEVRSSDVPKALDLFVEYFGEEDALEQIAKAMGDAILEENIDWIAQQWGFAEDIEELDDAWDKYETAKEIMGESELFNNLTQAAGYDELAEDLAFIFRMNDFREWDEVSGYDDDDEDYDDDDITDDGKESGIRDILIEIVKERDNIDWHDEKGGWSETNWHKIYDTAWELKEKLEEYYDSYIPLADEYERRGGTYSIIDSDPDNGELDDVKLAKEIYTRGLARIDEFEKWENAQEYADLTFGEWLEQNYPDEAITSSYSNSKKTNIINNRSFPVKTVKNILSGRWSEDYAAECIAQKQDINVGYAKQLLSSWIEQYKPKLIRSGILDIAEDINTEFDIDGDLESWGEQYVNNEGKSNTVGGEMVRAANQIIYRYNNDGDMIGRGYGNETVNAAARYITEKAEMGVNEQIQAWLDHDERADETDYDSFIETFTTEIEQILRENPELFQKPNKDDYWDWKIDDDMNYGLDECYLDDGLGNQYWFQLDADDRWYCTGIELDPYHIAYSEGDYISEGDDYVDEIDRTEEFGSFEADGFIYEYAGDEMDDDTGEYTSWQITKVTSTDPFCDEGDTFDFYDLEPDELAGFRLFDHNGNEIDERTFLASSLIKSNITSGEEVVIEIERHGKWEIVAQSDDERGWTLKGDAVPAIFDNKAEAKSSQLAKDLERDGYSPNQGNMRFKKYS